jgi:hypothetical protein
MLARSIRLALLLSVLALVPAAAANAASIWTPLTSGTSAQITAIAAPSSGEVVYTTSDGTIYYLSGSTFTQASVTPAASLGLTAIAMSTNGADGVAVGQAGEIYYSTDAGQQWTAAVAPSESDTGSCGSGWTGFTAISDNLNSARFVPSSTTVYITGDDNDVLRSTNGGKNFTEVNKSGSGCVADSTGAFNDTAWISPTVGLLISNQFGYLFRTINGFSSATEVGGGSINGYNEVTKLAIDLGNASDLWVVAGGGLSEGANYSTNGGETWTGVNFESSQSNILLDIANSGTTVVAVGEDGDVWTSNDGVNFYYDIPPAYPTTNWDAVAMVPGTNTAIIGGASGALAITGYANALPPATPPTGTISGPTTLAPGVPGTYTLHASDYSGGPGLDTSSYVWSLPGQAAQHGDTATFVSATPGTYTVTASFSDVVGNEGSASITVKVAASGPTGSGQKKTTTGGGTVGIYKKVTVPKGSSKDRYIPIYLLDKTPRKFVITLLTAPRKHKKQKTLATLTTTLKKGHKDVHLKLPNSVKSGSYELEVRLYTTGKHAKAVGKRIKQLFVLD